MQLTKLTKCNFCRFATSGGGCMVARNPAYCKDAVAEYQQYARNGGRLPPQKSLRSWDRNRK